MEELTQKLREDFPPEALSKDTSRGFELTSIKAMFVIERLTDAFGLFGWSYGWDDMEFHDGEWTCVVSLSVKVGEFGDENSHTKTVRQFGGKRVVKTNHTDAKKSAVTDGLTKCASMLGVGTSVFKGEQMSGNSPPPQKEFDQIPATGTDAAKPPTGTDAAKPPTGTGDATEPQRKKIYAMSKNVGFEEIEMKTLMRTRYKVESSLELTKKQASDFIEHLTIIEKQNQPPHINHS